MRKVFITLFLTVIAASLFACATRNGTVLTGSDGSRNASALPAAAADRYIVVLKPGFTALDVTSVSRGLSTAPDFVYEKVFIGFAGVMTAAEVARLKADSRVELVEPDLPVSISQGKGKPGGGGGGGTPPPQILPWGVDRIDAELNSGNGGAGVTVAIIDTGINLTHPDLEGAIVADYNVFKPSSPAEDDNGHGTHVAGTVGARDNNIGVVGVAPNCGLAAVKVLDRRGSGSISGVIAGVDWVTANAATYGIKVANMSLGATGYTQSFYNAIASATAQGVTFVVAAGNNAKDAANYQPARFDNVICVSAMDKTDKMAYYSNYGTTVEMMAPGSSVESLWKSGGYNTISGTSMASPHVAGAAALWLDNNNGGFAEVLAALTAEGFVPGGGWGSYDKDGVTEPLVIADSL